MFPWKIAFRFVSATVLLATGGYAAGAEMALPFDVAPTEVSAQTAPTPEAPATDTTAPADDDSAPDDSSTTTTAPGTAAPDIVDDPDTEAAPTPPIVDVPTAPPESPDAPATPIAPTAAPDAKTPTAETPTAPADPEAPQVCADAGTTTCGVDPAADNSFDARVARCRAWWTALADRLDERGRPQMAAGARRVADRCDEMVARWQQWQERRQQREDRRDDRQVDRKVRGDHNTDGRPDNGWHNKDRDRRDRDDNRSARARQVSRHSEGRR